MQNKLSSLCTRQEFNSTWNSARSGGSEVEYPIQRDLATASESLRVGAKYDSVALADISSIRFLLVKVIVLRTQYCAYVPIGVLVVAMTVIREYPDAFTITHAVSLLSRFRVCAFTWQPIENRRTADYS